jgi:ubiquitin C-terminal hydrolase
MNKHKVSFLYVLSYNMNKPFFRVGLTNLGNTCFLNSCVQILQQLYELHSIVDKATPKDTPDGVILKEWNELRKAMMTQHGVLSPTRFVHFVQQVAEQKGRELFTGWAQNDISEFLLFLIECMHANCATSISIEINGSSKNATDDRALLCYRFLQATYSKEYSKIHELFYGTYVTEILDPVTKVILSSKAEHYFMLDLQLFYENQMFTNIYQCLDLFVSPEVMSGENAWFNEDSGQKETVHRQVSFWNFPNILVILLKRFLPDGKRKLQTGIDFPLENLDLSRYIKGYQSASYKYDLFGVCNHMGGVMGGHYTAYVKNGAGVWHHYNDTLVEPLLDMGVIRSPAAYCLFYRKKIL